MSVSTSSSRTDASARLVFLTRQPAAFERLQGWLGDRVSLLEPGEGVLLAQSVQALDPVLVFIDFDVPGSEAIAEAARQAASLAQAGLAAPMIAVGNPQHSQQTLLAFRSGVKDFVDLDNGQELQRVVNELLKLAAPASERDSQGKLFVMVGARVGVGVSCLAAHLSSLHQQLFSRGDGGQSLLHLDLGWPIGDGQLYLNASSDFHFVEAVRNAHRIDETLLDTALGKREETAPVLSLPKDLSEMRKISHLESMRLIERLRELFDCVLVDVGGFANPEFIAALMRSANQVWVVTDQSVSALVSLVDLLADIRKQEIAPERVRLIVNRYEESYGLSVRQIEQRHGLKALQAVPDRPNTVMEALNQGRLVHEAFPKDPYAKALKKLARQAFARVEGAQQAIEGVQDKGTAKRWQWWKRPRS
ncbi:MAG: fimbrial protein [Pigmentiphaga sp.]|nr:fimbrial protein [Pigmentiphaga sp.]